MTLFKGHHTTKIHGKAIIGENNNESGGGGEQQVLDGMVGGLLYSNGTLFTGVSGGSLYSSGTLFTGVSGGSLYSSGTLFTGNSANKYYSSGILYTGYTNSNYYNNGDIIVSDGSRTWNLSSSFSQFTSPNAVLLDDGTILFAGGVRTQVSDVSDLWEIHDPAQNFNVVSSSIITGNVMTYSSNGGFLLKLTNGKVAHIGGSGNVGGGGTFKTFTELFDPTTKTWTRTVDLPNSQIAKYSTCNLIPGTNKVILVGGTASVGGGPISSVYIIDFDANTITQRTSIPQARQYHAAIFIDNTRLLVTGGTVSTGESERVYLYNVSTNAWTLLNGDTGNIGGYINSPTITKLSDGRIYILTYSLRLLLKVNATFNGLSQRTVSTLSLWNGIASGSDYPDADLTACLLPDETILLYGRSFTTNGPGLIGVYDTKNTTSMSDDTFNSLSNAGLSNLNNGETEHKLILLSNNKLIAYNGNNKYSVMDF